MIVIVEVLKALAGNKFVWFGVALLAAVMWGRWEHTRYVAERDSFLTFRTEVNVKGTAAKDAAAKQTQLDQLKKEKTDADYEKRIAVLGSTVGKLRREADARGSGVPAASPTSKRPDLACFDRAEYQRAYGEFTQEIRGLADEGTAGTVGLDVAKEWGARR